MPASSVTAPESTSPFPATVNLKFGTLVSPSAMINVCRSESSFTYPKVISPAWTGPYSDASNLSPETAFTTNAPAGTVSAGPDCPPPQAARRVPRARVEAAAETLGASSFQRAVRIILPAILPALLSGVGLAFARGVGEYGSVIFIAGNMPLRSEIAPLLIVIRLEEFDYDAAGAIGIAMLLVSFAMLLLINLIQVWSRRRIGHV